MNQELERELIKETTIEDVPEKFRPFVELVGIENVIKLSKYALGDEIYFPKPDTIIRKARNRRIKEEYTGYNEKELAKRYDVTIEQIKKILRDCNPQQISIFDIQHIF